MAALATQFAYRTSKIAGLTDAAPLYQPVPTFTIPEGNIRCCVYSPDGIYFAYALPDVVVVVEANNGTPVTTLALPNVFELGFSPQGRFFITWQRYTRDENGDGVKNLKVWRLLEALPNPEHPEQGLVGKFVQKSQTGWNLQYTPDEKYCARTVTNEIQFFESDNLSTVFSKLRVEGVTDFALSPGARNSIAVFVPERNGQAGSIKIYHFGAFEQPVTQKNFFKADKVNLNWSDDGSSLICLAQTEVDKTGKSYYGETTLYLLSATGGLDTRIDLDKEGPVHDVVWSPNAKHFAVVYGYMPAKTVIFNLRADPVHTFPLGPRNSVSFSPHGRFLLVAGFGNLAGDVDIYDAEKDYAKVCTFKASNASVCSWSPDGQHILTATTSPRLRVDNGVKIYHASGQLMYNQDMHELYHVVWRPLDAKQFPLDNPFNPVPAPHPSATAYLGTVKTPSKPAGAYRPPGARGTSTPLAFMREDQGGAAFISSGPIPFAPSSNGFGRGRRREVPGAEPAEPAAAAPVPGSVPVEGDENLSKAALKNKKKRENKKAKEAADKTASLTTGDDTQQQTDSTRARSPGRPNRDRNRSRSKSELGQPPGLNGQQRSRANSRRRDLGPPPGLSKPANGHALPNIQVNTTAPVPSPAATPDVTVTTPGGSSVQEKKVRALTKKLRAIEDLKMRRAAGEKLEATQLQKMDTEEGVRKDLENLGWTD